MANIEKPIWSADGQTLTNVLVNNKNTTYNKVSNWYDGTPMDDSKLDDDFVYVKYEGEYLVRNMEEGQVLQKDTVDEMRNLSTFETLLLKMGIYKHVQLNGYYEKGDTPEPINYNLSDTVEDDDGGSVIDVGNNIKLEHVFIGMVDARYYGVAFNDLNEDYTGVINGLLAKHDVFFTKGVLMVDASVGVQIPSNRNVVTEGTIFRAKPTDLRNYQVIDLKEVENVTINELYIEGERDYHLGSGGEWGMGLNIISCKNIKIGRVTSNMCWGDGVYMGVNNLVTNENIRIGEIHADRNRRQGLSIISGKDIYIDYIKATNTNGTNPQYGVDIEPNNPEEILENINIGHIVGKGNVGGTLTTALMQLDEHSPFVTINIGRITSYGELSLNGGGKSISHVKGEIRIDSIRSYNAKLQAITLRKYLNRPDIYFKDVLIINANTDRRTDLFGSAILIYLVSGDEYDNEVYPKIHLENVVIKNPDSTLYNGVRVNNDVLGESENIIKNVFLKNIDVEGVIPNSSNVVFNTDKEYIDELGKSIRHYTGNFRPYFNGNMFRTYTNQTATIEGTATIEQGALPTNSPITFRSDHLTRRLTIDIEDGEIVDYGSTIKSSKAGDYISIKCIDIPNNIWIATEVSGEWDPV